MLPMSLLMLTSKIPWFKANKVIPAFRQCTAQGLYCLNSEQPDGFCEDYEKEFRCFKRKCNKIVNVEVIYHPLFASLRSCSKNYIPEKNVQ